MNLREARQVIGSLDTDPDAARVFGEVYETADGATVIPVTNVRGASKPGVNTADLLCAPSRPACS